MILRSLSAADPASLKIFENGVQYKKIITYALCLWHEIGKETAWQEKSGRLQ